MIPLPIDESINEVVQILQEQNNLVLISPPGSGKTTRVPPAIVKYFSGKTLLLQPRRVAVRRSAFRIAEEQSWSLGKEVGYQIRFEKKWSTESRLIVVTEGILARSGLP